MQNPNSKQYITWENALFIAASMISKGYTKDDYKKQCPIVKGAIRYLKTANR